MSLIKQINTKRQVIGVWEFGRLVLALSMSFVGIFLLSTLILPFFGITGRTPLQIWVFCFVPFIPFSTFMGVMIYEVFLSLKKKCKSEWDFWMIMLSFSLAGMFIMPVRKLIFHMLGITLNTPLWIKVLIYIPIIPPTYYAGLLVFGTILGQNTFFMGMIAKRLKLLSGRKNIKQ